MYGVLKMYRTGTTTQNARFQKRILSIHDERYMCLGCHSFKSTYDAACIRIRDATNDNAEKWDP
jgi:hypothetical protein